ncbi:hypothetical protein FZW96_13875 [Bacillus sp. BGMRC 2118]|nr:hypothetical protein FZW96_13875 [Bacillus sp. BGMRC 2118]
MFLEMTEEFSQFMMLVSILVTLATIFTYGYFLKSYLFDQYSLHKPNRDTKHIFSHASSRMLNQKTDDIRSWITKTTKRLEAPDDVPSHILLVLFSKCENNQGGYQWKRKQHSPQGNFYILE